MPREFSNKVAVVTGGSRGPIPYRRWREADQQAEDSSDALT